MVKSDYLKYRGKCKQYCDRAVRIFPVLKLVRGHYHDWQWGEQMHWWCVRPDGSIFDPTAKQFPSKGNGDYIEFDGYFTCESCGKKVLEENLTTHGHHTYCSGECLMHDVGF